VARRRAEQWPVGFSSHTTQLQGVFEALFLRTGEDLIKRADVAGRLPRTHASSGPIADALRVWLHEPMAF